MNTVLALQSLLRARVLQTVFALAALLLVGLHPFTYTSLASSFDGLLHLYRLIELDHLFSQGIWFSRWAPDFVFGFGYPIFNFYAPLSYYFSALLHALGLSFADTATAFFVLCTLGAATAMYLLADSLCADRHAAMLGAIAYAYAPTHIYDNFYRSAWGTVLAYALAPLALWSLRQWHQSGRRRYLTLTALACAGLMLAHNVSALLTMPVIGGATLVFWFVARDPTTKRWRSTRGLLMSAGAIAVGLALSAYFWLPAISETQYVQTWRLTIPPDFDFRTHFLAPSDWFAWPAPAEVGRINPDLVNTLGPLQALLAAGGLITGLRVLSRRGDRDASGARATTVFFATTLAVSLFMTLPASSWLWEQIPILPSIQFPHRFLTLSALCAAILGAGFIAHVPVRGRAAVALIACALVVISSIPFLYPRLQPLINPNPTLADMLEHEHKTGALGTTASGEYFPVGVKFIPRSSAFEEAVAVGDNPQRFETRSLPAGGKVLSQEASALAFSLRVNAPQPFDALFRHFYFPGWQGYVDGQAVPTGASAGQGFSTFNVPHGEHQIELRFTSTPVRDVAAAISFVSLMVGLAYLALVARRRSRERRKSQSPITITSETKFDTLPSWRVYFVLGIALFVMKLGIADRYDTPLRVAFDGLRVHGLQYPQVVGLGGAVTWLGYDLSARTIAAGESFDLRLTWLAQRELDTVYSSFAQVVDEHSNLYAQKDNLHPGGAPTTNWREREYDVDRHVIDVPPGTPPGEYWIAVGLYDPRNGVRLLREQAQAGQPLDHMLIGPVTIRKPAQAPSVAELHIKQPLDRRYAAGISLLGYALDTERLPEDDSLRLALFWRADQAPLTDLTMRVRLLNEQEQAVASQQSAPSNDRYPTSKWSAGELVRDNRALWVPRALPGGTYRVQIQLDGEQGWMDLASVRKP